jgi:hypothetical protein
MIVIGVLLMLVFSVGMVGIDIAEKKRALKGVFFAKGSFKDNRA